MPTNTKLVIGIALAFGGIILMSGAIEVINYQSIVNLFGVFLFIVGLVLTLSAITE